MQKDRKKIMMNEIWKDIIIRFIADGHDTTKEVYDFIQRHKDIEKYLY